MTLMQARCLHELEPRREACAAQPTPHRHELNLGEHARRGVMRPSESRPEARRPKPGPDACLHAALALALPEPPDAFVSLELVELELSEDDSDLVEEPAALLLP